MKIANVVKYGLFDSAFAFPKRKESAPRVVKSFELEYLLECDGAAHVDERTYKLYPGSVLVRKPGETSYSTLGFKCLYVHVELDEDGEFYPILAAAPTMLRLIDSGLYRSIFAELTDNLARTNGDETNFLTISKLLELFYRLASDSEKNRDGCSKRAAAFNERIPAVVDYVEERLSERLTLSELSAAAGYSPNYFLTVFTRVVGESPQKFVTRKRVERARALLSDPQKGIAEVAYECGFGSQSYFTRIFKEYCSLTPRAYRKSLFEAYSL